MEAPKDCWLLTKQKLKPAYLYECDAIFYSSGNPLVYHPSLIACSLILQKIRDEMMGNWEIIWEMATLNKIFNFTEGLIETKPLSFPF